MIKDQNYVEETTIVASLQLQSVLCLSNLAFLEDDTKRVLTFRVSLQSGADSPAGQLGVYAGWSR